MFFRILFFLTMVLAGCATNRIIEPESAEFHFAFGPPDNGGEFLSVSGQDTLQWKINKAHACIGEIGIHWSWSSTVGGLAKSAHDSPIEGKISPKIYDYYAVDFLKSSKIQTLQVEPKIYDHIHMIFQRAVLDTIIDLAKAPALKKHSLYFEGTVRNKEDVLPFRALFDSTYSENDLGDITFKLQVQKDDSYNLVLRPKLDSWFNDIIWTDLTRTHGDTAVIAFNNVNKAAAAKMEKRFTLDNVFKFEVSKNN